MGNIEDNMEGYLNNRKFTIGVLFIFLEGVMSWKSKLKKKCQTIYN